MTKTNYTEGSILKNLLRFSLPFLFSCFLQTFYGMADLFIAGQYNNSSTITAVSVGSQLMHMLTVIIVGLSMGTTVLLSHSIGARDNKTAAKGIGNTVTLFSFISIIFTAILLLSTDIILKLLAVPAEALAETKTYTLTCFCGIIFITAYNVLSSIYRGLGDTKHPMYFVMIAGILNIGLDYLFIGQLGLKALGAALATVIAQALSVILAIIYIRKTLSIKLTREDFTKDKNIRKRLISNGAPIAIQDGLIQISFLIITMFANKRGVDIAAAVGIVEKIICFLFLVPSAMLSSVSALAAQNIGANNPSRAKQTLYKALSICITTGIFFSLLCNLFATEIIDLFTNEEPQVVLFGAQYLRSYVFDTIFAGIHFCFSGYFCAIEKPLYSFYHNIISIVIARIPLVWMTTVVWPNTLLPMGMAAPIGSLLSALICIFMYRHTIKPKVNKTII